MQYNLPKLTTEMQQRWKLKLYITQFKHSLSSFSHLIAEKTTHHEQYKLTDYLQTPISSNQ